MSEDRHSLCRVSYRLPGAGDCCVLSSSSAPDVLSSPDDLCERSGFLIAPFAPAPDCPVVMVRPDRVERRTLERRLPTEENPLASVPPVPEDYRRSFEAFHSAVSGGRFDKLVLAASLRRPVRLDDNGADALFLEACRAYPDFMVTLFSTPLTGTWLSVSPELLLEGEGERWRTMALAGTMPLGQKEWSGKNRREQALVERFVQETLERFATDIDRQGPKSRRAGHLQHLCTAFDFRMERSRLGALLSAHAGGLGSGAQRCFGFYPYDRKPGTSLLQRLLRPHRPPRGHTSLRDAALCRHRCGAGRSHPLGRRRHHARQPSGGGVERSGAEDAHRQPFVRPCTVNTPILTSLQHS